MKIKEKIGFGCYLPGASKEEAEKIISTAMDAGYRYFDTASFYETERSLGEAFRKSGLNREDLFIASKLWIDEKGHQGAKDACRRTLERIGVDYLDAYLIHWPRKNEDDTDWQKTNCETFRAMRELHEEGLTRLIGVSNFLPHHLNSLAKEGFVPEIDQLELHPGYMQECAVRECKDSDIIVQAWSPLGRGALLENKFLQSVARKYNKSVPQICLIYLLQRGIMPIVKASSKNRMLSNMDIFDVELSKEDLQMISCMPQAGWSGEHPDFSIPKVKSKFEQ